MRRSTPQIFSIVLALVAAPTLLEAQIRPCPASTSKAQQARAIVADYITSASHSAVRTRYGIAAGDTTNLSIVTADSVCEAVTARVDGLTKVTRSHSLIVIAFQTFFVGVDPDGDVIDDIFILDSSYRPKGVLISQE